MEDQRRSCRKTDTGTGGGEVVLHLGMLLEEGPAETVDGLEVGWKLTRLDCGTIVSTALTTPVSSLLVQI